MPLSRPWAREALGVGLAKNRRKRQCWVCCLSEDLLSTESTACAARRVAPRCAGKLSRGLRAWGDDAVRRRDLLRAGAATIFTIIAAPRLGRGGDRAKTLQTVLKHSISAAMTCLMLKIALGPMRGLGRS